MQRVDPFQDANEIRFAKIGIRFTDNKLLIWRTDRPKLMRLTILFETASEEVDFHFTYNDGYVPPGKPKHISLARIKAQDFAAFNEYLPVLIGPSILQGFRTVNLQTLTEQGYVVLIDQEELISRIFRKRISKKKDKATVSLFNFDRSFLSEIDEDQIVEPADLTHADATETLWAVKRSGHESSLLPLFYMDQMWPKGWYTYEMPDTTELESIISSIIPRGRSKTFLARIVVALRLLEIFEPSKLVPGK